MAAAKVRARPWAVRACVVVSAVLVLLCAIRPAFAQSDSSKPSALITLGWGGQGLVAGRWNPVRIELTGGTEILSVDATARVYSSGGEIAATHRGDHVHTPERSTGFDLAIVPAGPVSWGEGFSVALSITGKRADGKLIDLGGYRYEGAGLGAGSLPDMIDGSQPVVLSVGVPSLGAAGNAWSRRLIRDAAEAAPTGDWSGEPSPTFAPPTVIPLHWRDLATSRADWMLYDSATAVVLSAQAAEAVTDAQRDALLMWVESGGRLVVVLDASTVPLARWGLGALVAITANEGTGEAGMGTSSGDAVFRITPEGAGRGWTTGERAGIEAASGPVGLGWCTLLVGDPSRGAHRSAPEDVWLGVLEESLRRPTDGAQDPYPGYPSGSDDASRLNSIIDTIAEHVAPDQSSPAGIAVFVIGVSLLLAVLLGPVDWIVLRRRRLQHLSWATALGWIAIAAVIGIVYPMVIRSGASKGFAVTVEDIDGRTGLKACSEVTGAFSTTAQRLAMPDQPALGWWRIVEPHEYWRQPVRIFSPTTRLSQGAPLAPIPMKVWSFATAAGEWVEPSPVRCEVRRAADGEMWLRVEGLESGGHPVAVTLWMRDGTYQVLPNSALRPDGGVRLGRTGRATEKDEGMGWATKAYESGPYLMDGAARRTGAMVNAVGTGRFALVSAEVVEPQDVRALTGIGGANRRRLIRVLAPIVEESPSSGAASGAEGGTQP